METQSPLSDTPLPVTQRRARRRLGIIAAVAAALTVAAVALIPSAGASQVTSIFGSDVKPTVLANSDDESVELGIKFRPQSDGRVTALRYYQGSADLNVTRASLWSDDGKSLAQVRFSSSDTIGWRTVKLDAPVDLSAGQSYVASYHAWAGRYPSIGQDLAGAKTQNGFALDVDAGVYAYASGVTFPTSSYRGTNYLMDVVYESQSSVEGAAPSTAPAPAPVPTVAPTTAPTGGTQVLGRSFPSAASTGVPRGTSLSAYTGPCTIQSDNLTIDAKTVNCDLRILAKGIKITRSVINGTIYSDPDYYNGSFSITDSEVRMGDGAATGIGDANFTATRIEVTGGSRSVNCYLDCTVQDSFLHGQYTDTRGIDHESGVRIGSGSVLRHNTIGCTAPNVPPDAGCSAAITGYGDFATVQKVTIDGNLILAGSGGYCSYGGSTSGKPYSAGVNNIKFTNNVWQKGKSGQCGYWGPITSFDSDAPGNVWSNNLYDDGKPVPPAN